LETHFTYFFILAVSLLGPLVLSFDKKVAFHKKWKYVFKAMLLPAALFIAWDIYFTSTAVWSFNPQYITGIRIINLPIEEALFFLVVPYCCLFVYECIRVYFPNLKNKRKDALILKLLAGILLITGIFFHKKSYTSWTFISCAVFIFIIYANKKFFRYFDATSFIISYSIILVPFLAVNGYLTSIPVVLYNDAENLGLKIFTIPFEDTFYGMLLVMMNVAIYEKVKSRKRHKKHKRSPVSHSPELTN